MSFEGSAVSLLLLVQFAWLMDRPMQRLDGPRHYANGVLVGIYLRVLDVIDSLSVNASGLGGR